MATSTTIDLMDALSTSLRQRGVVDVTDPASRRFVLEPDLTLQNRQKLKMDVVDAIAAGARSIELDASACGYIDTAGLGVLVSLNKKCRDVNGTLTITHLNADMRYFLAHVRLDSILNIEPRITDADRNLE